MFIQSNYVFLSSPGLLHGEMGAAAALRTGESQSMETGQEASAVSQE